MKMFRWCCGPRDAARDNNSNEVEKVAAPNGQKFDPKMMEQHAANNNKMNSRYEATRRRMTSQAQARRRELLSTLYDVDFSDKGLLGKGHFAEVYAGKSIPQNSNEVIIPIAAKRIHRNRTKASVLRREITALLKVRENPGVVTLYDVFYDDHDVILIMDLMAGGELFERIVKNGAYSERDASKHIRSIAVALNEMHSAGIVHRDLKPENLCLVTKDPNSEIKIADFGLSRILVEDEKIMNTVCGTRAYAAPEVNFGGGPRSGAYTSKVDTWSLGVIMFIILSGYHPFDEYGNSKDGQIWSRICQGKWYFDDPCWKQISQDAQDLIRNLIETDPDRRFSAKQILQHRWISQYEKVPTIPLKSLSNRSLRIFISMQEDEPAAQQQQQHPTTITEENGSGSSFVQSNDMEMA